MTDMTTWAIVTPEFPSSDKPALMLGRVVDRGDGYIRIVRDGDKPEGVVWTTAHVAVDLLPDRLEAEKILAALEQATLNSRRLIERAEIQIKMAQQDLGLAQAAFHATVYSYAPSLLTASEIELSQPERFTLTWLADDDRGGLLGECRGVSLDRLMKAGFVALADPARTDDWARVVLTKEGRARVALISAEGAAQ